MIYQLFQPKDEIDYFDINVINNGNNDVQDVWTISPQNFDGNTGQWLQGRVQIEASGDPEYQVIYIVAELLFYKNISLKTNSDHHRYI